MQNNDTNNKAEEKKCPVCSSDKLTYYANIKTTKFIKCLNCKLVFAEPAGDKEIIYDEKYIVERGHINYPSIERAKKKSFLRYIRKINKYPENNRMLEIGCSSGFALEVAQKTGWHPTGIEINDEIAKATQKRFENLNILSAPLSSHKFPDQHFTAVIMFDVIEHLPDPYTEMKEICRVLKKNGTILIVTPNILSLSARILKTQWPHFMEEHLFYYSPEALQILMSTFGIAPIETGWAGKYVSTEMIKRHCEIHKNVFASNLIPKLIDLLPPKLKEIGIWFNMGEMFFCGKKI